MTIYFSKPDADKVRRLQSRILAAMTNDDGSGPATADALEALTRTIEFFMCRPECRQNVAEELGRRISGMLADANELAAELCGR